MVRDDEEDDHETAIEVGVEGNAVTNGPVIGDLVVSPTGVAVTKSSCEGARN